MTQVSLPVARIVRPNVWRSVVMFLSIVGPGIITANADNDVGGILTYSQAGAQFGYSLLWLLVPITVALVVVQEMCARMGAVTGKGLADLIRENFGVKVTFWCLLLFVLGDRGRQHGQRSLPGLRPRRRFSAVAPAPRECRGAQDRACVVGGGYFCLPHRDARIGESRRKGLLLLLLRPHRVRRQRIRRASRLARRLASEPRAAFSGVEGLHHHDHSGYRNDDLAVDAIFTSRRPSSTRVSARTITATRGSTSSPAEFGPT